MSPFCVSVVVIECCCDKSGLNQSEDQRIQHDEVCCTPYSPLSFLNSRRLLMHILNVVTFLHLSTPSSRSEPSPKTSRQALSIKQAFLGGKADGRIHSPHSPKAGEERRPIKGEHFYFPLSLGFVFSRPLILYFFLFVFFWPSCFICVPPSHQMTPVRLGTELLGKLEFQGSCGGPLKRKLLQGSHLGFVWMTVHLHPPTGSV